MTREQQVLDAIAAAGARGITGSELRTTLGLSAPDVTRFIERLRIDGAILTEREGRPGGHGWAYRYRAAGRGSPVDRRIEQLEQVNAALRTKLRAAEDRCEQLSVRLDAILKAPHAEAGRVALALDAMQHDLIAQIASTVNRVKYCFRPSNGGQSAIRG